MERSTKEKIERNIDKLVEKKILKSKEALENIRLDKLEDMAHKLDVCPKELLIYLTCGGDCDICTVEHKSESCGKQ